MADVSKRRRQPKGIPTGGEFADENKTKSAGDLNPKDSPLYHNDVLPAADADPRDIVDALAETPALNDVNVYEFDLFLRDQDDEAPWRRLAYETVENRKWLDENARTALLSIPRRNRADDGQRWILHDIAAYSDPRDRSLSAMILARTSGDASTDQIVRDVMRSRAVDDIDFRRYGWAAKPSNLNLTPAQRLVAERKTPDDPLPAKGRPKTADMLQAMLLHPDPSYRIGTIQANFDRIAGSDTLWTKILDDPDERVRNTLAVCAGLPEGERCEMGAWSGIASTRGDYVDTSEDVHTYVMDWDGDEAKPMRLVERRPSPDDFGVFRTPAASLDGTEYDSDDWGFSTRA